ncbi:MAG: 30S ribosome-binding factor RbfA [Actinomycetota bacterium]
MSYRPGRVAEAFREEIMDMIQRDLKDPRIGFVTVTHIEVSPDLNHATVFISILGDEAKKDETLKAMERAKRHIRSELGKRVRLKFLPELEFVHDTTIEESFKVSEIIKKIHKER